MRRILFLTALFCTSFSFVLLACGDTSSKADDGNLPLPDRRLDGDAEAGIDDAFVPAAPKDASDAGTTPDAEVAGLGCKGALDCERVVFVTKATYVGSAIGGLSGGDAKCQAAANTATAKRIKGRTFQAWLSTTTLPASLRIPHGTKPFVLNNGTIVANDWTDLTDGNLVNGIDRDETNTIVVGGSAWTGTATAGATASAATCGTWDASNADGTRGNVGGAGGGWSSAGVSPCTMQLHLYCFEL